MENNTKIIIIISIAILAVVSYFAAATYIPYKNLQTTQEQLKQNTENLTLPTLSDLKAKLKIEGYNTSCEKGQTVSVRIYGGNFGTANANNVKLSVDNKPVAASNNATLRAGVTTSWIAANSESCTDWINKTRSLKIESDETSSEKAFTFICTAGNC